MVLNNYIKYRDILIFALIGIVGYKIIDNYTTIFNYVDSFISIISPFIYAIAFAYILNPIMNVFERKLKLKRGIAILITYFIITALLIVAIVYVIPNLISSIFSLTYDMPTYIKKIQGWVNDVENNQKISYLIDQIGLQNAISDMPSKIGRIIIVALDGFASSMLSVITNLLKLILGFLISIYVLTDKDRIIREAKLIIYIIFKEKRGYRIIHFFKTYDNMIGSYIGTKAIDSLIIGLLSFVGLTVLNIQYAALLAIIVGVTNMIPYFGPLIGEIIGGIMGLFVSPVKALAVIIFLLSLHQFDAWYLDPKLIGEKVGVRPLILIFAVIVGGGLFGVIGMILASPTAATIKIFYDMKTEKYREEYPKLSKSKD